MNYKFILVLALLLISSSALADCRNKIDPSKVMLFIDTNDSGPEITTAEKAACERGEKLIIVPKNYKDYERFTKQVNSASRSYESCKRQKSSCKDHEQKFIEAHRNLENFKASQKPIKEQTTEMLKEIKSQKGRLQNFIISGHNGGGNYGGSKGNLSREELKEIMTDFKDINDVTLLMLLGCYTGVQKEILEWKNIFPQAKLIAGYDGAAPLSDKPLGHDYITEILLQEKSLISISNEKELQDFARSNIKSLFQLHSALYMSCEEDPEKQFYYASKNPSRRFAEFDMKECLKKGPEIQALQDEISKFNSGEIEPPLNSTSGEIRSIYNKARSLEHCLDILESPLNVNAVFNLLFYDSVKKNFASFYREDLTEAERVIDSINLEEYEENTLALLHTTEEDLNRAKEDLELIRNNSEKYFAIKQAEVDELKKARDDFLAKHPHVKDSLTSSPLNLTGSFSSSSSFMTPKFELAEFSKLDLDYENKASILKQELENPAKAIIRKEDHVKTLDNKLTNSREKLAEIKNNPGKLKEVWAPTLENISKKSRKDLLKNLHHINGLLSGPGLTPKQEKALAWITTISMNHLQHFKNPFSWHEYIPGHTETPQLPLRLNQTITLNPEDLQILR